MKENQLIFLMSQPRSGSTLTQKILGTHSKIYTRSEPWLMLHSSYALKDSGLYAEYSFKYNKMALNSFIDDLPEGKSTYIKEVKKMHLNLYAYYIDGTSCEYFLDKTPRYYLIVDELLEIFPKAKYILLLRNPLAVLGSIINTWSKENWYNLTEYKNDLLHAIDAFVDIVDNKANDFMVVRYEDLVLDSEKAFRNIFEYLGMDYEGGVLNYEHHDEWIFGDPVNVYKNETINSGSSDAWKNNLNNPQYWRVINDYLHYIGEERFEKLGYNFAENASVLEGNIPANSIDDLYEKTFSLFSFLDDTRECLIGNQVKQGVIDKKNNEIKNYIEKFREIELAIDQANKENQELLENNSELHDKYNKQIVYEAEFFKMNNNNRVIMSELKDKYEELDSRARNVTKYAANLLKVSSIYHPIKNSQLFKKSILELHHSIKQINDKVAK